LAHLQRGLEIEEKTLPADSPLIGATLMRMGEGYLNLKQPSEAKRALERALKLLESSEGNLTASAWGRFLLARALWDTDSDREQAVALAHDAASALVKAGRGKSEKFREVQGWLSTKRSLQARVSLESSK